MSIKSRIENKIRDNLKPVSFEVINESAKHKGHAGDDGSGESHFKLIVVSPVFDEKTKLECHRLVCDLLKEEIAQLHAISMTLKNHNP